MDSVRAIPSVFRGALGVRFAERVVGELAARGIPTSPENYELWSTHLAGANQNLSREIQALTARSEAFTEAVNGELRRRYLGSYQSSGEALEASAGFARELAELVGALREVGAMSEAYAQELDAAVECFDARPTPNAIRETLAGIVRATRQASARNRAFEDELRASMRRVELLKSELRRARGEALTDGLTGLANRKYFEATLRGRVGEAARTGEPLCLILCDIDHFKRVNDTWGHLVGDQVIRYVAQVLANQATGGEFVARYGGEEFAIIAPGKVIAAARGSAETVRLAVRARHLSKRSTGEGIGRITLSLGVAEFAVNDTSDSLIRRADACLYQSKRVGRDKVTCDTEMAAGGPERLEVTGV